MPPLIALLGRRGGPTDGLEDYSTFLGEGLLRHGFSLKKVRMNWIQQGWIRSFFHLWRESAEWRGNWVLLQFTSLAWSRRGFPFAAWAVVATVRSRGGRTAVVFHESRGIGGPRWIDRFRSACQNWIVRRLFQLADRSIFTDPLETVRWLPKQDPKAVSIPIGGNIPEVPFRSRGSNEGSAAVKTIAVYCLGDPPHRALELADISEAIRLLPPKGSRVRLMFLGRGTSEASADIASTFSAMPIELLNLGIQSADEVARLLAAADAMICVRGRLFPRRGSALAGISSGVPIVAYAGASEGTPIADAGVELVPYRDVAALSRALNRILTDDERWQELHRKSVRAYETYFSWNVIAGNLVNALGLKRT